MPAITIQSLELTDDQKAVIADKYVSIFSELTNVPKDRIYIFFDGYTPDNVGTNGVVFSKNLPKTIRARFNEKREA
jgi:phenylpyruvate tautomerase PptA (4-oxalocrotonate tautomerase family)